jgi:hypothetical protein
MANKNEMKGWQKLLLALFVVAVIGTTAQAAWDAVAVHKKGATQQNVNGSINVAGAVRAGSFCALGADACMTGPALAPPPACSASQMLTSDGGLICAEVAQIDLATAPTNGSVLQYNGDAAAYEPSPVYEISDDLAPVNGNILSWNGDAGYYEPQPQANVAMKLNANVGNSDAAIDFILNNQTAQTLANQRLLSLQNNGVEKLGIGSDGTICLEPTCGQYINYSAGFGAAQSSSSFLINGSGYVYGSDFVTRAQVYNNGATYGGSVAVNDPVRWLSTTTALLESSTAATAGVDTAFTVNSLVTLAAADKLVSITNNGVEAAYFTSSGLNLGASGNIAVGSITTWSGVTFTGANGGVFTGYVMDSAAAVGVILNNDRALTTAGAKLLSVRNNNTEKAYIDLNGHAYFAGGVDPADIRNLNDAGYVWDDIRVPLANVSKSAVNAPTITELMDNTGSGGTTTGIHAWAFSNSQEDDLLFEVQMPHSYTAFGMPVEAHIHWTMITTSTASPAVTWGIECSSPTNIDGAYTISAATTNRAHSGTTATLTMTAANQKFDVGHNLVVAGVSEAGCSAGAYNGNYRVTAVTDTTISYTSGAVSCTEGTTADTGGTITGYTITKEVQANVATNSKWKNIMSEFGTFRMKNCTGVSCIMSCRLYRPNVADLDEAIPAISLDFHFPMSQMGSRGEVTP